MDKNIRRSIKKISFEEPKGVHIKALAIYLLILSCISYIIMNFITNNKLIVLAAFIITMPLYLNLIKICLDCSRDVLIDSKDLFKIKKYSFKFTIYYTIIILIFYILNIIFNLIGFLGIILNIITTIYILPVLILMPFIFLDNPNISFKNFVTEPIKLIKKNLLTFYGLLCSFTIWFLLSFLTLGILYLWLIPYIMISMAYLYLNLKKEKTYKKEKALSNSVIVILFILFIIITNIISFKIYPDSFTDFKENFNLEIGGYKNE